MTTMAVPVEAPVVRSGDLGCLQTLPCRPGSAKSARLLVSVALRAWSLDHLYDTAGLLISELVANTVRHTDCPVISVSVARRPGSVWFAVNDSSDKRPVLVVTRSDAESGYGMGLVDSLSSRWGVAPTASGKRVWFELTEDGS